MRLPSLIVCLLYIRPTATQRSSSHLVRGGGGRKNLSQIQTENTPGVSSNNMFRILWFSTIEIHRPKRDLGLNLFWVNFQCLVVIVNFLKHFWLLDISVMNVKPMSNERQMENQSTVVRNNLFTFWINEFKEILSFTRENIDHWL